MRRPTFAVLSLLLFCPSLIAAAPHESIQSHGDAAHSPRPWRKLSDAIIRKVWGLQGPQKSLGADTPSARGTPGRDLVARYGDDIVLRFNITSPDEASALAEAADILFLDVWEFNSDWVDIRIAKDVVGCPPSIPWLPVDMASSRRYSASSRPLCKTPTFRSCKTSSLPKPSFHPIHPRPPLSHTMTTIHIRRTSSHLPGWEAKAIPSSKTTSPSPSLLPG